MIAHSWGIEPKKKEITLPAPLQTILLQFQRKQIKASQDALRVGIMLASAQTAEALLQCCTHTLARRVASPNARSLGFKGVYWSGSGIGVANTLAVAVAVARRHLRPTVTDPLLVFQSLISTVCRLAFAFQVIGVVFLCRVSCLDQTSAK
jgi:hypothetical protein